MMAQNAAPLAKRSAPLRRWLHRFSMSSRSVCDLMSTTAICPPFPDRLPRPARPAQCQQTGDRILLPVSVCPAPEKDAESACNCGFVVKIVNIVCDITCALFEIGTLIRPTASAGTGPIYERQRARRTPIWPSPTFASLIGPDSTTKTGGTPARRFGVPPTERCRYAHCRERQLKHALSIAML